MNSKNNSCCPSTDCDSSFKNSDKLSIKAKDEYIQEKIRTIYQDFLISINEDEEEYLYSLKTRYAIDDACDQIIKERL